MVMIHGHEATDEIREIEAMARPLYEVDDLDPLLDRIGDSRFVLIGEASHGTSEYYRWRASLTRRLIAERDFSFVGVEGDWPDCYVVNRWVKGLALDDLGPEEVLEVFGRWPTWMWANEEVAEFIAWLKEHNRRTGADVGFYGLDVYSLWESMRRITTYLAEHQPDALPSATEAYRCFEPYGEDPQRYAWATRMVPTDCEDEVVDLLREVRRKSQPVHDAEARFDALQNAEVLAGAERYYRAMVRADGESWNIRDLHMSDTLDRLTEHHGENAKAVVWEHNTHIGDARGTDMARAGMLNVGQVARERHAEEGVVLVGFGSHRGSVIAARSWGDEMEEFPVPAAPGGTHEDLLHANGDQALLVFPDSRDTAWLSTPRGHRAIGVVYNPSTDRGNWVPTVMGRRYDAFIYFDETRALNPLGVQPRQGEMAETYPWGR